MENFEEILRKDLHIERFYLNRDDNEYPMTVRVMLEASAAGGMFTISFSHRFTDDAYLNAFLDELREQNLTCEIADRHPLQLAPIADHRKIK